MATHSTVLAWRIPGMGESGGLLSMGLHSRTRLKRLSNSSSKGTLCTTVASDFQKVKDGVLKLNCSLYGIQKAALL